MGLRDEELQNSKRLDNLKEKLYSPNEKFGIRRRRDLHEKSYEIESDWEHDEDPFIEDVPKKRISVFLKLLVTSFLFFLVALFYAGYVLIDSGPKTGEGNIDIAIIGPVSIGAGETLSYDIVIQNNDSVPMDTVDLIVTYPEGSKKADDLSDPLIRTRESVGDLASGDIIKRTKTAALFGNENENKQIEVGIEYRIPGISTIFKKKKIFDITLQSSPIRIALDAVDEHIVGQNLDMKLTISSNSTKVLENVMVSADYPFGFNINDTTNTPTYGNNIWYIGNLKPKEEKTFIISGDLQGQNNEERVFHFFAGLQDEQVESKLGVTFTSLIHSISIERPFFAIDIDIDNDNSDTVIQTGEKRTQAVVKYINNLNVPIYDAEVVLKFSGDVLDKNSVGSGDGFYDSINNTITWNKSSQDFLSQLEPRDTKTTRFTFASKDLGDISSIFTNPEILIDAKITGKRLSEDNVEEIIESETFRRIRFNTRYALQPTVFYAVGPFENTGNIPPKAEYPTEYTIQWDVFNTSNKIENARVVGTLPPYVTWKNKFTPENANVTFDPVTRIIKWDMGIVEPGTGYSLDKETLAFQVTLVPSISQIGKTPDLIANQQILGTDSFTGSTVSSAIRASNTSANDFRQDPRNSRVIE